MERDDIRCLILGKFPEISSLVLNKNNNNKNRLVLNDNFEISDLDKGSVQDLS